MIANTVEYIIIKEWIETRPDGSRWRVTTKMPKGTVPELCTAGGRAHLGVLVTKEKIDEPRTAAR